MVKRDTQIPRPDEPPTAPIGLGVLETSKGDDPLRGNQSVVCQDIEIRPARVECRGKMAVGSPPVHANKNVRSPTVLF